MAGKKPESTRKSRDQQGGNRKQKLQQQQGEPEEFQNQQGEIREQDYAEEMNEIHKQERGHRE